MDFKIIEDAGLSRQEFADIIGISRMALFKIIKHGNYQRIAAGITLLDSLVSKGKLPREYDASEPEKRKAMIEKLRCAIDRSLSQNC